VLQVDLRIRWQQKVRNEEVKKRIGANRNVFQIIIYRKLQFFGHICRMKDARMLKAIVFGVMGGKTRNGRPCREWTDDITDWCKEDLHTLRWKATDRAECQRVVRHAIDTNG